VDIARSEQVESELDAMIRRRDTHRRQTEGERLTEELYEPSVRAWRERQEAEKRTAHFEYHRDQAERLRRTMGELVAYHEAAAERYVQDEPKGAARAS
jgi:hypothetical protein